MKGRGSQGHVLSCLVTTCKGFPTGSLLVHMGAGPQFLLWNVAVVEHLSENFLLLDCHFLVSCREQAFGGWEVGFCFVGLHPLELLSCLLL